MHSPPAKPCSPAVFEALFRNTLDAVFIAGDDRRYVDVNASAAALLGVEPSEIIGHSIDEFFEVEPEQAVPEAWKSFRQQGYQLGVCRFRRRPDGETRLAAFRAKANFWPGLHAAILRDITEPRALTDALHDTNAHLNRLNEELARSNRELNQFAFAVGHDLRAPLRTVASFAELLMRSDEDRAEKEEYVTHIRAAVSRMTTFIDDLLSYSQARSSPPEMRVIDAGLPLAWALANLNALIQEMGAIITHDRLPVITADDMQIARLFQNLIGNALKYCGSQRPRVHIGFRKGENETVFCVADNGTGIAPEYRETIFEIFKRLHGSDIPGTGLGLSLCQRIVENHGGRIWVDSEMGQGATFFFSIPN